MPDPSNPQAFNRYSYVINNPLVYTDPSGHDFWKHLMHEASRPQNAFIIQNLNLLTGSYFLTQSMAGRNILAGEIVVGTAAATWYCGGCGTGTGALTGEIAGGISSDQSGGNVLDGVIVGGVVGGATGYMGAEAANNLEDYPYLAAAAEGAIRGFGTGVATGYAGGKGDMNTMLSGGLSGAVTGGVIGGLTPYGQSIWNSISPGSSWFLPGTIGVFKATLSGTISGLTSPPIKNDNNGRTTSATTTLSTASSNFTFPYYAVNLGEAATATYSPIFSEKGTSSMFNSLTVKEMGY